MAEFLVIWSIDIEADSHREAAQKALEIQRDPDSTAVHFTVCKGGIDLEIDLKEEDGNS